MNITLASIILLTLFSTAQAEEASSFEQTYPIIQDGEVWDILTDTSELGPHFKVSKLVIDSTQKHVLFDFKTVKDFEADEARKITGVWLNCYDKEGRMIGCIDHTRYSLEKCAKLFSITKNLKQISYTFSKDSFLKRRVVYWAKLTHQGNPL